MPEEMFFEANDKVIQDALFQNYIFKIPRYQRPYSWTEDEITEFWNDLNEDNGSFFLGSFIFNHEPLDKEKYIEIVDGQQRILTITILIAAIRDLANSIETGLAEYYHRRMIVIEKSYQKWSPRIICGDSTIAFFTKYIQDIGEDISQSIPQSAEEKLIKNNYLFFYNKIKRELDHIDAINKKKELLDGYIEKISKLIVIYIKIIKEEDAYEIFETTNARGLDLNVADLLKNWIFKNIRENGVKDVAKDIWQDVEANVQTDIRRFLRYYWISYNPFVTERKLYKAIKNKITNWDEFLDDIWKSSDHYNLLLQASEEQWQNTDFEHSYKMYKSVSALKIMNVSQCYVLFLSILKNYKKLEMDPIHVFEIIEKFSFLYSAICKQPTNKVEKLYNKYAIDLGNLVANEDSKDKKLSKVNSLFSSLEKELKELRPTFDFFSKYFMDIKYKNSEIGRMLVKYILSEINNFYEKTKEHKIDFNNVNVEHIIPQTPGKDWDLSVEDIKDYVNLLGNLTLVDKVINSKAGNKSLKEKLLLLADSELPITKELISKLSKSNSKWDKESICERQLSLAHLAYDHIWKF